MAERRIRNVFARPRTRAIVRVAAFCTGLAVLAGVAVVAQGFDVKQTPLATGTIWALKASNDTAVPSYARVNTELSELETIKPVYEPSELVQTAQSVLVLTAANTRIAPVDLSQPQEITADSTELENTPTETSIVVSTGDYVGYLSETGHVAVAEIDAGVTTTPVSVDPFAAVEVPEGEEPEQYIADAIAIGQDGILYSFSAASGSVLRFDIATGKILDEDAVAATDADVDYQLSAVGDDWVLVDESGALWTRASGAETATGVETPVLQRPSEGGDVAYVAGTAGLFAVTLADGSIDQVLGDGTSAYGTPAAPTSHGTETFAAWISAAATGAGTLWSSTDGESDLSFGAATTGDIVTPEFRTNGDTMILNDTQSGWVWTIPDGALVASSQDWSLGEDESQVDDDPQNLSTEVADPTPPVAEDDEFGVRAGQLVSLPVLLNDHDANEDVLTIVPDSVTGLKEAFGTLSATSNNQRLAVQVAAEASGTTTFSYQVTDGTSKSSVSNVATVTLTVKADSVNTAPVWCGVTDCAQDPVAMEVQPGASASVNALDAWVDPEGDALYIQSVSKDSSIPGTVASTPDGSVFFQDSGEEDTEGTVPVTVTVSDSRGETADNVFSVTVTSTPALTADAFAMTTRVDENITVDPAAHLGGVTGTYAITSATTEGDGGGDVSINSGTTMDFTAGSAGSYVVTYTVQDDLNQVVATMRVTVVADDDLTLSTAPVTVFVRPKLDTTVDVFTAVSNPGNRLLLLTAATTLPDAGAYLDADVVGNSLLRIKGNTTDSQPGVIGTVRYTVTDGDATSSSSIEGVATVVLLADSVSKRPIAVNDSITVRAGAQVDIPVLANDVSTDGNALVLDSKSIDSSDGAGLVFASGSAVRYLAPAVEGEYTVSYSVYSAGAPTFSDRADITITVRALGDNKAPRPQTLIGRVVAGKTVSIPFDDFGIDPDGDSVILDRIVEQPESGSATISARGDAIIYTSVAGFRGPVDFSYSVKDSEGKQATAAVRVGVLDETSDQRPITFTDYVEVKVGVDNFVEVYPAANDIDPLGKAMSLSSVVPDESTKSDEYEPLAALIVEQDEQKIRFSAGDSIGTKTFKYTVSGDNNVNQADGYIVIKVVSEAVPDTPRVTDSYVSIDDRSTFASTGIDVLSGKVSWLSGDISALTVSLWAPSGSNPADGFAVEGSRIKGTLPADSMLLPFTVAGTNFAGEDVATYGFLRVPGVNDIILALKASAGVQQVKELEQVDFDVATLVSTPPGDSLIVDPASVRSSGQRTAGECAVVSATVIRYIAGEGAPYGDSCRVDVQLAGQDHYTTLAVPIAIEPLAPVPVLSSASRRLSPAEDPATYNLQDMVEWQGVEDWDNLQFAVNAGGDQFETTYDPKTTTLTYRALGSAPSGSVESIFITITGTYADASKGTLYLTVGPAPTTLPRGATVSKECSIASDRSNCSIRVIGAKGEVNIYEEDGPLTVSSVDKTASCAGVTFSVTGGDTVRAQWSGDIDGAQCQVSFVVADIRKQKSSGDRNGRVNFDLHGLAKKPDSIAQVSYDDGKVDLAVNPGASTTAYPALTGFIVKREDGTKATTCDAYGSCNPITGLVNGEKHTYTAFARNAEGDSKDGASVVAWSFEKPSLGNVTRTSVYDSSLTSGSKGAVDVTITGSAKSVDSYEITGLDQRVTRTGNSTTVRLAFEVGSKDITVNPISSIEQPAGKGPVAEGETKSVTVVGSPGIRDQGKLKESPDSLTLSGFKVDENNSDRPLQQIFIAYQGAAPTCAIDANGGNLTASVPSGAQSTTETVGGLTTNQIYSFVACASNGYGLVQSNTVSGYTDDTPNAPEGYTYTIATTPTDGVYKLTVNRPAPEVLPTNFHLDWNNFDEASGTTDRYGSAPDIQVRYCRDGTGLFGPRQYCSDYATLAPTAANQAYQLRITHQDNVQCTVGQKLGNFTVDGAAGGYPVVTAAEYLDSNGAVISTGDPTTVPAGTKKVRNITLVVTWTDPAVEGLDRFTWTNTTTTSCIDNTPPVVTPTPTATPTPTPTP